MRDISDYTRKYEKSDFENKYQVKYSNFAPAKSLWPL